MINADDLTANMDKGAKYKPAFVEIKSLYNSGFSGSNVKRIIQ